MRIGLMTMGAAVSAEAVRRVVESAGGEICLVADSSPFRGSALASLRRTIRLLQRSRLRLAPYLLVNFLLPRLRAVLGGRSLARLCRARGIDFMTVQDINAPEAISAMRALGIDALLLFHFDQILSPETISHFPAGVINVHPSLLPAQRGPVPTIHLLLQPQPSAGVTIHRVTPRIDAGAIVVQRAVDLPDGASAIAAAHHLHIAAVKLVPAALAKLRAGDPGTPPESVLPYCGFPDATQLRRLRALGRRTVRAADLRLAWAATI